MFRCKGCISEELNLKAEICQFQFGLCNKSDNGEFVRIAEYNNFTSGEKKVKSKGSADSDYLFFFDNVSVLTKESRKFQLKEEKS